MRPKEYRIVRNCLSDRVAHRNISTPSTGRPDPEFLGVSTNSAGWRAGIHVGITARCFGEQPTGGRAHLEGKNLDGNLQERPITSLCLSQERDATADHSSTISNASASSSVSVSGDWASWSYESCSR